jgi:hypothetical protein
MTKKHEHDPEQEQAPAHEASLPHADLRERLKRCAQKIVDPALDDATRTSWQLRAGLLQNALNALGALEGAGPEPADDPAPEPGAAPTGTAELEPTPAP